VGDAALEEIDMLQARPPIRFFARATTEKPLSTAS
jgi:hypothetical protein